MKLGDEPIFLKLSFTPCKAEQSLRGMELQEKYKNHRGNYKEAIYILEAICILEAIYI